MMNIRDLKKYNAVLSSSPDIAPGERDLQIYNEDLLLYEDKGYKPKKIEFQVTFLDKDLSWRTNRAKFLQDLEKGIITFDDSIFYKGIFTAQTDSAEYIINQIKVSGICYETGQRITLELKAGTHKIVNMGFDVAPVELEVKGKGTITGLTPEPIKAKDSCTITERKLILKDNKLALDVVEMWDFPNLQRGINTIETTTPVTLSYYPRLI